MFAVAVDDQPIAFRSRIGLAAAVLISRCGNARGFERNAEAGDGDVAQRYWHKVPSPSERLGGLPPRYWHLIVPDVRECDLRAAILMRLASDLERDMLTCKIDMGG